MHLGDGGMTCMVSFVKMIKEMRNTLKTSWFIYVWKGDINKMLWCAGGTIFIWMNWTSVSDDWECTLKTPLVHFVIFSKSPRYVSHLESLRHGQLEENKQALLKFPANSQEMHGEEKTENYWVGRTCVRVTHLAPGSRHPSITGPEFRDSPLLM